MLGMDIREQALFVSAFPSLDIAQRLRLCAIPLENRTLRSLRTGELRNLVGGEIPQVLDNQRVAASYDSMRAFMDQNPQCRMVFYHEQAYPPLLREIPDAPFRLLYLGELSPPSQIAVSIVGTRRASRAALEAAFSFALEAALGKCVVVSGFAEGVDQAAHRGAVAGQGPTYAILGSGLGFLYPKYPELLHRIVDGGGACLSEYEPNDPPLAWRFPVRNRLISAMALALLVVEAPIGSGSLITADHALRQGREVLVHKDGLNGTLGAGTRALLEDGAAVVACYKEMALLADIRYPQAPKRAVKADVTGLNHGQRLLAEREGGLFRFNDSWFKCVDGFVKET
jgi:DNA processing protein